MSIDRGLVQFSTTSELGTVNANQFPFVQGFGLFIDQPSGDVAPVGLGATTLYTGLYATDTFDVTPRLSITAGGRFNFAQINLTDELGNDPLLNGSHDYIHFNPMIGATYKLTPNITLLRRFFRNKPRADAARARLLQSAAALPDRQCPGRRSQSQSGCYLHLRGRPTRTLRHRQRAAELDRGRLPRAQHRRHHQCREPDPRA